MIESSSAAATPREDIDALAEAAARQLAAGETERLLDTLRQLLEIDPNHAVGLYYFGVKSHELGRHDAAIPALQRALDLLPRVRGPSQEFFIASRTLAHSLISVGRSNEACAMLRGLGARVPDSEPIRQWLARVHMSVGVDFEQTGQVYPAIDQYRQAISLWPSMPGGQINLQHTLARTQQRSRLSDYTASIQEHELQPYLFVACMPKSGSSFLKAALCALTGFPEYNLSYAYLQNEQELYLPQVLAAATMPVVTQQHCRATEANVQMMQGFGIRPIVLIRSIPDVVSSLYDFYEAGATANTFFAPFWPQLSQSERIDLIIDHVVPWYLAFYASWVAVDQARRLEVLWLRYREMVADKPAAIARVATFYGISAPPPKIIAAIAAAEADRTGTRFNKGVVGRGAGLLSDGQKARIGRLASSYRGLDLSPIGL